VIPLEFAKWFDDAMSIPLTIHLRKRPPRAVSTGVRVRTLRNMAVKLVTFQQKRLI
jgi:hypothetical protein